MGRVLSQTDGRASILRNRRRSVSLLLAERDENTCRKSFTPNEAVTLGKALEELETPAAKARREASQAKEGNKLASKSESENGAVKITEPFQRKGDVRDVIGQAVGMSGPTYQRAKAVVEDHRLVEDHRPLGREGEASLAASWKSNGMTSIGSDDRAATEFTTSANAGHLLTCSTIDSTK